MRSMALVRSSRLVHRTRSVNHFDGAGTGCILFLFFSWLRLAHDYVFDNTVIFVSDSRRV